MWWWLLVVFLLFLVVRYRYEILKIFLDVFSWVLPGYTLSLDGRVINIQFSLHKSRIDAVIDMSVDMPSLTWKHGLVIKHASCIAHIVQLKPEFANRDSSSEPPRAKRGLSAGLLRLIPLPRLTLGSLKFTAVFKDPPSVSTPADQTGGSPWSSTVTVSDTTVRLDKSRTLLFAEVVGINGTCRLLTEETLEDAAVKWVEIESVSVIVPVAGQADEDLTAEIKSAAAVLSVEMFYAIIPTISKIFEQPVVTGASIPVRRELVAPTPLQFGLSISVHEKVRLELTNKDVGACTLDVSRIKANIGKDMASSVKASGCTVSRNSPVFGRLEILFVSPFSMRGTFKELDFSIPRVTLHPSPDGIVYWMRAMIFMSNKFTACKRPGRVPIRNERAKAYYDFQLCGIEPPDWLAIPTYIPKVVPMRIKLNIASSLEIRTTRKERIVTEDALIDCNLPQMEISFSANSVEVFGASKSRCALIKNFSGWVPQFPGVRLKDIDLSRVMDGPPNDIRCHFVQPPQLGPIPVCLRFADASVEVAEDLITIIGQQIVEAFENMRRWTVNVGYSAVPVYKPVTVRLSRIRFAPAELAPAVLDVKDFEISIGPTKDCLGFAFVGIKAWVPSTVVVPPILHVAEPALVRLRVKRLIPLPRVNILSDYSMQPGSWQDLELQLPLVKAAVAPGLHATTRFIDAMMKCVRSSMRPTNTAFPTPVSSSTLRKGPIKTFKVSAAGGQFFVVKESAGGGITKRVATEDIDDTVRNCVQILGDFRFGKLDMKIRDFHSEMKMNLEFVTLSVPKIVDISVSETAVDSANGSVYNIDISKSKNRPVELHIKDNGMAMFGAYSAIKDCFQKAWYIDPLPKLNSVITHLVDVNTQAAEVYNPSRSVSEVGERPPSCQPAISPTTTTVLPSTPLVNGNVNFNFPSGVECSWAVPNSNSALTMSIPCNKLNGEMVFHGFALMGDQIFRRLPDLTDEVLIQWLRYPWTVGGVQEAAPMGDMSPKSPSLSREKESWDLHSIMTMRISEYLATAGSEGHYEYASARGLIDTPVYCQLHVSLCEVTMAMGTGLRRKRIAGIEQLEMRCHCHNLPTGASQSSMPKLKVSYWTSWQQDPRSGLTLDLVPEVHIPMLLTLVGSPADADANSSVIHGLAGTREDLASIDETASISSLSLGSSVKHTVSPTLLDKALEHFDLGFRITIIGLTGRASGWCFAASRISLFKEEDKGKGLIVGEIRDAQIAMTSASGLVTQPVHSRACLGVPEDAIPSDDNFDVFPFISVKQMMVHVGLQGDKRPGTLSPTAAATSNVTTVFCNIQGGRVWWSPSLNRGMRISMTRTDRLVEMVSRWKTRFTNELFARIGKSRKKKKTFESIMRMLDWFISTGGSIKFIVRCADVQTNFHNLMTIAGGLDDILTPPEPLSASNSAPQMLSTPISSPQRLPSDIPKHFLPFKEVGSNGNLNVVSATPPDPEGSRSPTPEPETAENLTSKCDCICFTTEEDFKILCKHLLRRDPYSLEVPRSVSWWLKAGHMQNCPLPPLPLPRYYAPPNSRRERAIGAVKYDKWLSDCHQRSEYVTVVSPVPSGVSNTVKPKPRGSQLLLSATEAVFEIVLLRTKGPSNLRVTLNASLNTIQGSVSPTSLRGLVWLGQTGQTILRQILQIQTISIIFNSDLFPLKSGHLRLLIPKVILSTDDDAFHIIVDVLRDCILYRGALVEPPERWNAADTENGPTTPAPSRTPGADVKFTGPIPNSKREAIIAGLLTSLAVADANLPPSTDHLSVEYITESISVNLTHRQRCFVQLQLTTAVGKHAFSLGHPHRPMQFSFQLKDALILSSDSSNDRGSRPVLRSAAAPAGNNLLTIRGNDRYITLNNREWHVYDTLFLSTSPIVVDVTQDLIEELYVFIFPPTADGAPALGTSSSLLPGPLEGVDEQAVEVVGNRLLTGRNRTRAVAALKNFAPIKSGLGSSYDVARKESGVSTAQPAAPAAAAARATGLPVFFKFVRFGNIDSIITFKGKQFSLNHMSLTLKYYLKRRRLATWKEFLDEWGTKVGKQAFGSFVKHGFSRRKAIQDIIVNKFANGASTDIDKLLFGKFSNY